jgi:serine/threonine protein kinase
MPTDPDTGLYAVVLAAIGFIVVLVVVIAARRRRRTCARCGARVSRGAEICPACGSQFVRQSPGPVGRESPQPPVSSAELVAVQGPLAQQHFPISVEGLTLGRHVDNDVVLAGELMVSRHHAIITQEQGQYVLYDRDSANGTWVNDQRVFRHVLVPGDRIQIWQSQFVFALPGAPLPSPVPPVAAPSVVHVEGEDFAGYYLEGLIGRGGMSEVFKARDQNGQTVAIKILQQTDPYLVNKFVQEGNKIGPLLRDHANIVYVHKFGQGPDNRLYIAMEFVDAPCLRRVMQHTLGEPEIVSIVGQVCAALAFAHQNNVVHRDIKPENILVTADGRAKVLDFGIAKLTSASTVTRDKIVGTPEYISPEQARGDPVRPASDVYSLGIVLYEMLTGSVPFRRPRVDDPLKAALEVIRQHLRDRPEPLGKRNPDIQVSKKMEQVTMRALRKNIKDRYATAQEMGRALGYTEALEPTTAPDLPVQANLLILQGPRRGQRIALVDGSLALGRLELDPSDTAISRHHVSIVFRGGTYWLQDMSKNGTWLDNQRVYGEAPLKTGSVIMIGDNALRLESG